MANSLTPDGLRALRWKARRLADIYRDEGVSGVGDAVRRTTLPRTKYRSRTPTAVLSEEYHKRFGPEFGETAIWDRDWDVLIIVDSCRIEWMRTVADGYSFIDTVEKIASVGSHSKEFIEKTFSADRLSELRETIYVTGNHYASYAPTDEFVSYQNLFYEPIYPQQFAGPPAHLLTDRAVHLARTHDWGRLIVHYMQPHYPFLKTRSGRDDVELATGLRADKPPYQAYFRGDITLAELEQAYVNNLRYVLDEVEILLNNVNGDTAVITSDHGEALGDDWLWDHSYGVNHPALKYVPWVETDVVDNETLEPAMPCRRSNEINVEEKLRALGYR